MSCRPFSLALATALALLATGKATAGDQAVRIGWEALLPPDPGVTPSRSPPSEAGHATPGDRPAGNLSGRQVELTGFLLPSDREGDKVFEFLLVPWAGACSHMPSPPPNQVVLVTPYPPYRASEAYEVVTISGALVPDHTRTQLFILDGVKVVESGYRVSRAQVSRADAAEARRPADRTPWGFLEN